MNSIEKIALIRSVVNSNNMVLIVEEKGGCIAILFNTISNITTIRLHPSLSLVDSAVRDLQQTEYLHFLPKFYVEDVYLFNEGTPLLKPSWAVLSDIVHSIKGISPNLTNSLISLLDRINKGGFEPEHKYLSYRYELFDVPIHKVSVDSSDIYLNQDGTLNEEEGKIYTPPPAFKSISSLLKALAHTLDGLGVFIEDDRLNQLQIDAMDNLRAMGEI